MVIMIPVRLKFYFFLFCFLREFFFTFFQEIKIFRAEERVGVEKLAIKFF